MGDKFECHVAWCPKCFDALEHIPVTDGEKIVEWVYECFGCDELFEIFQLNTRAKTVADELKIKLPEKKEYITSNPPVTRYDLITKGFNECLNLVKQMNGVD